MDTFRLVLLYCFALTFLVLLGNFWLISHEYEQFSSYVWDFLKVAVAGEIIMFSLYKIATEANFKTPKFLKKHQEISEMEDNNGEITEQTNKP